MKVKAAGTKKLKAPRVKTAAEIASDERRVERRINAKRLQAVRVALYASEQGLDVIIGPLAKTEASYKLAKQ